MAAAYAAVVSLMNITEQIRNHPRLSTCFDDNQIQSLGQHLDFLLEYVESYSCYGGAIEEVEDLERRIASAAHAAEDVIESLVVDQIQAGFKEESSSLLADLQKIIQDMNLIKEVVADVNEKRPQYGQKLMDSSTPAAPDGRGGSHMATTVGLDISLNEIYDRLVRGSPCREVIAITGMSGIGKSTLARNAYENPLIMKYFERCAWASVSQEYNLRETLLQLLTCLQVSTDKLVNLSEDGQLGSELNKALSGVKYVIMLDGMCSVEAWDSMKDFFPENNNGSRIIVTTWAYDLAFHINSHIFRMYPLNIKESWVLLCRMAFGDESCPPELEETGRTIVKCCRGIPFLISVVGSFLGKSSMKVEYWEYVAERLASIDNSNEVNHVHDILMLCYDALPTCLKPCFLYMGMFPKNSEIRVSRLIKLWVAEGFLRPNSEEVGKNCMLDLIDRKLVLVSSRGSNKEPKLVKINDYFRDLCMRIAEKEKFFSLVKAVNTPECINNERRLVLQDTIPEKLENPQFLHARSLISESPTLVSKKSRLLRVSVEVYSDPLEATFGQVNLGFLVYESLHAPIKWIPRYELPPSLCLLWNMQTLVLGKKMELVVASSEIWKMQQLRHVDFYRIRLPDPPAGDDEDGSILHNLQTLGTVLNLECSEEVSKRMPNIKKLRVFYDGSSGIYLFSVFTELESLNCCFREVPNRQDLLPNLKFPSSLKKLVLQDCELQWDDISVIGSDLPLLEVLKLKCQSVRSPTWESGEFVRLKYLEIDSCYLIYWSAKESHFPVLEKLVLIRLYRLKEIPFRMASIPTVEEISVVECSISTAMSAARILKEQEKLGHLQLQVQLRFAKEEEVTELWAKLNPNSLKRRKEVAALREKIKSDNLQNLEELAELRAKMKSDNLKSIRLLINGL